jgi:hypothetical protein
LGLGKTLNSEDRSPVIHICPLCGWMTLKFVLWLWQLLVVVTALWLWSMSGDGLEIMSFIVVANIWPARSTIRPLPYYSTLYSAVFIQPIYKIPNYCMLFFLFCAALIFLTCCPFKYLLYNLPAPQFG